jgi:hypothetical protein
MNTSYGDEYFTTWADCPQQIGLSLVAGYLHPLVTERFSIMNFRKLRHILRGERLVGL